MATTEDVLTVIVRVLPDQVEPLRAALAEIGADPANNAWVPFAQMKTVHFARWVLLDAAKDTRGEPIPASLVFSTDFDLPLDRHLEELVRVGASALDRVYRYCEGYPAGGASTPGRVIEYLTAHRVAPNAFYIAMRGRSVPQIHQEAELHERIQTLLEAKNADANWPPTDAAAVRDAIKRDLASDPIASAPRASGSPSNTDSVAGAARDAVRNLPGLATLLPFLPKLFARERKDKHAYNRRFAGLTPQQREALFENYRRNDVNEDHVIQNQLTHVVNVKKGWLRLRVVKLVLSIIDFRARVQYTKGTLGGVPSIHFCHWTLIDDDRRLLFITNYDGSWENYIDQFIDENATGLDGIWGSTEGYPPTRHIFSLVHPNVAEIKAWIRQYQAPTQVWYSAYPKLSVQNIDNNTAIRAGLADTDPATAGAWAQRL